MNSLDKGYLQADMISDTPIRFVLSLLAMLILASGCKYKTSEEKLPPNILLIISDDQGWSDYGFMNHPHIQTPHLDRLSTESLVFTHGYATAPLCSPSLASIISGVYAREHGITGNDPGFSFDGRRYSEEWRVTRKPLFDTLKRRFYERKILTEYLSERNYRSLQTGKWWLGSWEEGHFDAGMTHGDPHRDGRHGDEGLDIGREGLDTIFSFIEETQSRNQPFFVWYAPFLPHTPHNPPQDIQEKYLDKTDSEYVAKYWAMCEWFDQTCGELISYLETHGLREETLIVYTTDNGWIQKVEGNGYAERSKRTPYEMGIRTPFMLNWPGNIDAEFDSVTLVSNIDIVPTLLETSGIQTDLNWPGINLLSEKTRADRTTVFAEVYDHDIANVQKPTQSLQYLIGLEYPWKLIMPAGNNIGNAKPELFNIAHDPEEIGNLATKNPDKVVEISTKISNWWQERTTDSPPK